MSKGPGAPPEEKEKKSSSSRSRTFSLNQPSHGKDFLRSDTRMESHAIDLSRARRRTHGTPRTSRTSRDAYAKRDNAKTSNSELDFPVGEPSVLLPQPPILLAEKTLCKSCDTENVRGSEDGREGMRLN